MKETPPVAYLLDSLTRAIDVIQFLSNSPGESVSLSEAARQTRINKTTVLRILRTLEHKGWVTQPSPGRFRPALRLLENRAKRVAFSSRDNRLPFPRAVAESIRSIAAKQGVELLSLDNRGSRQQTLRNAERMIRERVDCAVIFQAEADTGPELSSLFHDAGIPLISIDMAIAGASYFGADNYSAGLSAGRTLSRQLAESGDDQIDELLLVGNLRFGSLPAGRLNGFQKAFETRYRRYGAISVSTVDSRGSFETGMRLLRTRMRATRARQGLVVCVNDPIALGAVQAIEESGRANRWSVWSFGGGLDARLELRRAGSPLRGVLSFGPEHYGPQLWPMVAGVLEQKPVAPALFAKMKVLTKANVDAECPHDLNQPSLHSEVRKHS